MRDQALPLGTVQGKGQKEHGPGVQGAYAVHPHAQACGQHGRRPQERALLSGQGPQQQKGPERGEKHARHRVRLRDAPESAPLHPDSDSGQQGQQKSQARTSEQPAAQKVPARVENEDSQSSGPEQSHHIVVAGGQQARREAFQIPDAVGRRDGAQHGVQDKQFGMIRPGHALGIGGQVTVQLRAADGNGQHAL